MTNPHSHEPQEPLDAYSIALGELLRLRLTWLSYPAFERCIEQLLRAHGFDGIRSLGRTALKGRRRFGGADLYGRVSTPTGPVQLLVQLKRYTIPVPAHFVYELRGLNLSCGIPHGLIVTTSIFSHAAVEAARSFKGRPIRLIDGRMLGELMVRYEIGTTWQVDLASGRRKKVIDVEAFERLEAACRERRSEPFQEPREVV